jgi:DNA-binding SARP family transcriptional activator
MQTLSVCLLGEPLVRDANGPVRATSKKALGVFCYLAYTGVRHSRRELAALFWGGGNGDAARASLRTTLLRMPAAMAACLAVDRESIAATDAIDVDVRRFSAVATAGDIPALDEAIDLYRGPLLAGLDVDATADFDYWLAR